jgi:hypothetical protein
MHDCSCVLSVGRCVLRPYLGLDSSAVSNCIELCRTVSILQAVFRLFVYNCERSTQLVNFSRPSFVESSGARMYKESSSYIGREGTAAIYRLSMVLFFCVNSDHSIITVVCMNVHVCVVMLSVVIIYSHSQIYRADGNIALNNFGWISFGYASLVATTVNFFLPFTKVINVFHHARVLRRECNIFCYNASRCNESDMPSLNLSTPISCRSLDDTFFLHLAIEKLFKCYYLAVYSAAFRVISGV